MVKLSSIRLNPNNPRTIEDAAFERLKAKIERNPDGLRVRPIVIESWKNPVIIGGNQRLKALEALGYEELKDEWVQSAENWTEAQRREFLVNDNISDGDWEWEPLLEEYDREELALWGVDDIPEEETEESDDSTPPPPAGEAALFLKIQCDDESHARQLYKRFRTQKLDVKLYLGNQEVDSSNEKYNWALN